MALVTFKGWEGQWWKKIKVGKAALAAGQFVLPIKYSLAIEGAKAVGLFGAIKGVVKKVGGAVLGKVAPMLPGGQIIKTAVNIGGKLGKRIGRKNLKRAVGAAGLGAVGVGAIAGRGGGGGGGGGMGGMAIDPTTGEVVSMGRRRRINPGNVRAMRRAIRRVEAGARLYSKMFRISRGKSISGAPGVKVVRFKKRRAA